MRGRNGKPPVGGSARGVCGRVIIGWMTSWGTMESLAVRVVNLVASAAERKVCVRADARIEAWHKSVKCVNNFGASRNLECRPG